jgi:hypothetical protein
MLGAVFVPINFRLVAREVGLQFDACTPKALLAELKGRPSFPPGVVRHVLFVESLLRGATNIARALCFARVYPCFSYRHLTPQDSILKRFS